MLVATGTTKYENHLLAPCGRGLRRGISPPSQPSPIDGEGDYFQRNDLKLILLELLDG
jgi:hypothetical protein